jgi:hypothetical protein
LANPWFPNSLRFSKKLPLIGFGLLFSVALGQAQTNLEYWAQQLSVSLTGWTNGVPQTNGVIARARPGAIKLTSTDLIRALTGDPISVVGKGITNYSFVTTNRVQGTNYYTTNVITWAVPTFTPAGNFSVSSMARLMVLEPVGTNGLSRLMIVRDGSVDYDVSGYFQFGKVSFDGRSNNFVTEGRFDVEHDLVQAANYCIEGLRFDSSGFALQPPTGTYFDVQGMARERKFSLTKGTEIIDHRLTRSELTTVAGTGQMGGTNGFAVLQGRVALTGGTYEVK